MRKHTTQCVRIGYRELAAETHYTNCVRIGYCELAREKERDQTGQALSIETVLRKAVVSLVIEGRSGLPCD